MKDTTNIEDNLKGISEYEVSMPTATIVVKAKSFKEAFEKFKQKVENCDLKIIQRASFEIDVPEKELKDMTPTEIIEGVKSGKIKSESFETIEEFMEYLKK